MEIKQTETRNAMVSPTDPTNGKLTISSDPPQTTIDEAGATTDSPLTIRPSPDRFRPPEPTHRTKMRSTNLKL